jgi:hypothetical protein
MPTRMSGGAAAAAVVLVALGLAGCTFGDDAPDPTSSSSTVAPGVEPTDKGGTTPKPDPADAVMSYAGVDVDGTQVSAAGYVQGLLENGGACTFTFTGLGDPVSVASEGIADSSTTSCGTVSVPIAQLPSGTWTVTLSYTSAAAGTLTSSALTVEVP